MERKNFIANLSAIISGVFISPGWVTADELRNELNKDPYFDNRLVKNPKKYIEVALLDENKKECDYSGYSRVNVLRDSEHWNIKGTNDYGYDKSISTNAKEINFGECTGGIQTIKYVVIYWEGLKYFEMKLTSKLFVASGITPLFRPGDLSFGV